MKTNILGFIGAGNMAEAIIRGCKGVSITVSDVSKKRIEFMKEMYDVKVADSNVKLVEKSNIIILAVKPQISEKILNEIKDTVTSDKLIISIMAGKKIDFIKSILGNDKKIVRIMPNTPSLISCGMNVFSGEKKLLKQYKQELNYIAHSLGKKLELSEDKMDIVTALSGSGPAYIFNFADCMINAGIKNGLSKAEAGLLVKQTILGAARMMMEMSNSPKELRRKVTSPGGTTEAALNVFSTCEFEKIINKAVCAAKERSEEL